MNEPLSLTIQELEWTRRKNGRHLLSLAFRIVCPGYDPAVRSPRVTLRFFRDGEDRRLPAKLVSAGPDGTFSSAVLFYSAKVEVSYVFTDRNFAPSSLQFELAYGANTFFPLPVSADCTLQSPADPFLASVPSDGAALRFDAVPMPETPLESKRKRPVAKLIRAVHSVLLAALSVALLPWFLLDAFLAAFSLIPASPSVRKRRGKALRFLMQLKVQYGALWHVSVGRETIRKVLNRLYRAVCFFCPVKKDRVSFFSCRRNDLSGNPAFVQAALEKLSPAPEFRFLLKDDANLHLRPKAVLRFLYLYATSSVVFVDEFFRLLNYVDRRPGVRLIQLWHSVGAFKTVGFSRVGKPGGPKQSSRNHRQYDYAVVSGEAAVGPYAEAFGLPEDRLLPLGTPRADIFFDGAYAEKTRKALYETYPMLKGKRVILFAPTFRGVGPKTAFYPLDRFSPAALLDAAGPETVLLLKLHPFCKKRFVLPPEYEGRILDLSDESELNDLLFVTDLLITDYSSCVFEASMRGIPMLFYAFDLAAYTATRDFYYEFAPFVPGKIVQTEEALREAVRTGDFEAEKVAPFREKFCGLADGKAAARVAALTQKLLTETEGSA